ncbi:MAG: HDOD domain-containing protein, partial [Bacteroidetes bacterium]|nr:HDOD domain-containing protein [Bacteroidota bacterium]
MSSIKAIQSILALGLIEDKFLISIKNLNKRIRGYQMDRQTLFKKLDRIEELPTLPAIALQVNAMLQDYDTSIKELTDVIEKDQAIVPKILKLVNSAFFGFRSKIS